MPDNQPQDADESPSGEIECSPDEQPDYRAATSPYRAFISKQVNYIRSGNVHTFSYPNDGYLSMKIEIPKIDKKGGTVGGILTFKIKDYDDKEKEIMLGYKTINKERVIKGLVDKIKMGIESEFKIGEFAFFQLIQYISHIFFEMNVGIEEQFPTVQKPIEFEEEIRNKATEILRENPITYIMKSLDNLIIGENLSRFVNLLAIISSGHNIDNIHVMNCGTSQKGKTFVQEKVLILAETFAIEINSQSSKAMYYKIKQGDTEYFKDKVILIDEFVDKSKEEAIWEFIKALTTAGRGKLHHETVIEHEYVEMDIVGLPPVVTNAVEPPTDIQISNRFNLVPITENSGQDMKVNKFTKRKYGMGMENLDISGKEKVLPESIQISQCIISILREEWMHVVIPYSKFIMFADIERRNETGKFLTMLKAITILNKLRRVIFTIDEKKFLVSTKEDFIIACEIWNDLQFFQRGFTDASLKIWKILDEDQKYTPNIISEMTDLSLKRTKKILETMLDKKLIKKTHNGKYYNDRKEEQNLGEYATVNWKKINRKHVDEFMYDFMMELKNRGFDTEKFDVDAMPDLLDHKEDALARYITEMPEKIFTVSNKEYIIDLIKRKEKIERREKKFEEKHGVKPLRFKPIFSGLGLGIGINPDDYFDHIILSDTSDSDNEHIKDEMEILDSIDGK